MAKTEEFSALIGDGMEIFSAYAMVGSKISTAVEIGTKLAEWAGWIESNDAKIDKANKMLDQIDQKVDTIIELLISAERKAQLNVITSLDDEASNLNDAIKKFRNLINAKIQSNYPDIKACIPKEKEGSSYAAIYTIYKVKENKEQIFVKAAKDVVDNYTDIIKEIQTPLNRIYHSVLSDGISQEGGYESTAMYYYDKRINERYNWDLEACQYREIYRIKLGRLFLQGSMLEAFYWIVKEEGYSIDDIIEKCNKFLKFILVDHGADKKTSTTVEKKDRDSLELWIKNVVPSDYKKYAIIGNHEVHKICSVKGKDVLDSKFSGSTPLFTANELNEMSRRAGELGRTLKEDMVINAILPSDSDIKYVACNEIMKNNPEGKSKSNGSNGSFIEQTCNVRLIDITEKNSKVQEKKVYHYLKTSTVGFFKTNVSEETITNDTVNFIV